MNVFDLFAKISLDKSEYDKGLNDAEKSGESFGGKIAKGIGTATKVIGAGIATAATGVAALTKSSVAAYADYEQLVGGVETLFGAGGKSLEEYAKDQGKTVKEVESEYKSLMSAQNEVMANASDAYKTAGLSANEYMETVTSFAASLNASLGGNTEMAAKMADMAITDMSDNANKMGSSMESIQNAYQGFAKQNYTMLDNLKLGYGGTKEEMQRLLDDAEKLSGIKYDLSSYADIVDAIHVVQTEMGITGTTAKEATETISGSLNMMKASWKNMVTAFADPDADFGKVVDDLVTSLVGKEEVIVSKTGEITKKHVNGFLDNIMPAIEMALDGIGNILERMVPIIADKLPGLIDQILPSLLSAATTLVTALVNSLPSIIKILVDQAPLIINTIIDAIIALTPEILMLGFDIIMALADGIVDSLDKLIPAIIDIVLLIVDKLTDPDTIVKLLDASLKIMVALAEGLMKALPRLIEKIPQIIQNLITAIVNALPKIVEAGLKILESIIGGILKGLPKIPKAIQQVKSSVTDGILKIVNSADEWGRDLIMNFINGIRQKFNDFKAELNNMASTVKDFIGFSEPKLGPLSNFHTYAPDMMELFAKGIKDNSYLIEDQFNDSLDFGHSVTSNIQSSVGVGASGTMLTQIYQVLTEILNKQPVEIAADSAGIFEVVQGEAKKWNKTTGLQPFPVR